MRPAFRRPQEEGRELFPSLCLLSSLWLKVILVPSDALGEPSYSLPCRGLDHRQSLTRGHKGSALKDGALGGSRGLSTRGLVSLRVSGKGEPAALWAITVARLVLQGLEGKM